MLNNLGLVLGSDRLDDFECTTDDFLSDFSNLLVGSTIIL